MKVVCAGGGPAGLYFAILLKRADPSAEVTVLERNAPGETFGWGVVFSDETLGYLAENDPVTHREITRTFAHWDAIDVCLRGQVVRSGGHGFSGIARRKLLEILQARAAELGVDLVFQTDFGPDDPRFEGADLVVAADGVSSRLRAAHADVFRPHLELRHSRYMWLGTRKLFDAFTFLFAESRHGVFQVHAYRFDESHSTFIAECDEASWRAAGLDIATVEDSVAFLEELFASHLDGHPLLVNKSSWIQFVTVRNARWHAHLANGVPLVLMGDAAHTAHFSIGSGTKMAMEDAIALARSLSRGDSVDDALRTYEDERRPVVERTQRAAQDSLMWFESVKRYTTLEPVPFAFSLLSRSKRITYDNLRLRDPAFVEQVASHFAERCEALPPARRSPPPPPMFTPLALRGLTLRNRVVVSPMCMYSAVDGTPNDFHLVHLGSMALGGAALVMTEMTDVSADGRITPGCTGMYREEHVEGWRRIVEFVHERSGTAMGLQLGHAGRKGSTRAPWEGEDEPLDSGNWPLLAPSPLPYHGRSQAPRAMDRADMDRVIGEHVRAAAMGVRAGFDLLEVHMAHGYLLASFLSPLTNQRDDAYGGSLEKRLRFPLQVLDAVRAAWPADRPLSVRISATDWVPGGLEVDDAVQIARALADHGCDIVDVSTGQTTPDAAPIYGRMYQARFSEQIRAQAGVRTISVGNIMDDDHVNTLVASYRADLCALARPHLVNPHLTLAAARKHTYDGEAVLWPSPYRAIRPRRS